MGKIIDISSKLDNTRPKIKIGEQEFEVNDSLETMMKFEEMLGEFSNIENVEKTIEIALGKGSAKLIGVRKMSFMNLQVVIAGIMCSIQGTEDVDAVLKRFQNEILK